MKKYKHKQTGDIATELKEGDKFRCYYVRGKFGGLPPEFVENTNDWEEIVEKEYEILSFICIKQEGLLTLGDIVKKEDKKFKSIRDVIGDEKSFLSENELWSIHSVKRLSDGEVFTIGDRVKYNDGSGNNIIENFYIEKNELRWSYKNSTYPFQHIGEKFKQPLFTTQDNKEVFYRDDVYLVWPDEMELNYIPVRIHGKPNHNGIFFSTIEAAENYIKCNKPCLSLNDVLEIIQYNMDTYTDNQGFAMGIKNKLTKLVKTRIKQD